MSVYCSPVCKIRISLGGTQNVIFLGYGEEHFVLVVGIRPARKTQRNFFVVIKAICISGEITETFLCVVITRSVLHPLLWCDKWANVLCSCDLGKYQLYFVGFIWTGV
jgi:hypothetical protein